MNYQWKDGGVTAPAGFTASGIHCGIRKNKTKRDLALIAAETPCAAAAVYTQNLVKGAPLVVTERHLQDGYARAVICNSGNANTCNADGEEKAMAMAKLAAEALGIKPEEVIVASTGVIGQELPIEPIAGGIPALVTALSKEGHGEAAEAILTTDTCLKERALHCEIGGKTVRIGGMAKGSGMIHPNMATLLCFITTDCAISPALLGEAVREAADASFNMVSVDGDTSTNDMASVMASGLAGNREITEKNAEYMAFTEALTALMVDLSKEIARDGEGATKLLIGRVTGAKTLHDAREIAKAVICSSLFKAAMFGADANWGRVLCAIGYSGCTVDVNKVGLSFSSEAGQIVVCEQGAGIPFDEGKATEILSEKEVTVLITLEDGDAVAEAYGCDLTYEYVKINGEYRT